ncbi:interferon gamma receptor 1 isoform X2 [Apus apus]|nr:interferon gamma receptor 1 isoform X2 [Apus apus]
MSETPRFIVEIKPYIAGSYKIVSTCVNITYNFCDLSREIQDPFDSHWLHVKAVIGSQQSEYVESNEFILQRHGKIGPPKLNLSRHGDKIMVDIYHPPFPSLDLPWLRSIYSGHMYSVTSWDGKNESKEWVPEDDCTMDKCSLNIPIAAEGSTYCVSAKGSFYDYLIVGTPSEKSCIYVPLKHKINTQHIIILCVGILILCLIVTAFCGYRKLRRKNIMLPKSLANVIRSLNTDGILESKSEAKYVCVVDVVPCPSAWPVIGEVTSLEGEPKEETLNPENSSEEASSLPPTEAPAKAEEVSVQESMEEVPSDNEHSHKVKESYFISDSSRMDMSRSSSDPEVSAVEIQQSVVPRSQFSGYDKPHVPLDMLIDVGEEQPVIAYRPTD